MKFEFAPDLGVCRLCGSTTHQREFWPEIYLGGGQSLRRCGHCAALYLGPDFTPDSLNDFYAQHYRKLFLTEIIGKSHERFFQQRFEHRVAAERLRLIAPLLPQDGQLFELGSGFGSFLGAVAQARPDIALYASEHDAAHRTLGCKDAQVEWVSQIEHFSQNDGLDAIAAFHVLEHLPQPVAFARWALQKLRPGGHLVIEVPDASGGWHTRKYVHPAHLTYFTPQTLQRTLQTAGLEIVQCGPHPAGAPFAGTLLAIAQRPQHSMQPSPISQASNEEIAAIDRHVESVRWTLADAVKSHGKQAMINLVGEEKTGAFQRWLEYRRMKKHWNA